MTQPESSSKTDSPWMASKDWLASAKPIDESIIMPQTIAGVFDEAFDLYKRHFGLLATIVAVGIIPIELLRNTIIAFWLHPLEAHLSSLKGNSADSYILLNFGKLIFGEPRSGFAGVLALLVLILLSAPIAIAVSDLYFGRLPTLKDCYRRSAPYLLNMIWGYCLVFLVFVGVAFAGSIVVLIITLILGVAFAAAGLGEAFWIVLIISLIALYFCSFALVARYFVFLTPLTVLEGLPAAYVSNRNFQLIGKKRVGRTWAATAALPIIWIGFMAILNNSLLSAIQMLHLPSMAEFLAVSALNTGVHFFLAPYWIIFVTLLYYDYRVRREGFDVRLLSLTNQETTPDQGGES